MQANSGSDEDDLCFSLPRAPSGVPALWQGVICQVLLFVPLIACLVSFSACGTNSGTSPPFPFVAPTSTPLPTPVPTSAPTPVSTPSQKPMPAEQQVTNITLSYMGHVFAQEYGKAYEMLSMDQQARVPFKDFVNDPEYTLSSGCWSWLGNSDPQLQADGLTWKIGIYLARRPPGGTVTELYSWEMSIRFENDAWVIVAIGLLPTGLGDPIPADEVC